MPVRQREGWHVSGGMAHTGCGVDFGRAWLFGRGSEACVEAEARSAPKTHSRHNESGAVCPHCHRGSWTTPPPMSIISAQK